MLQSKEVVQAYNAQVVDADTQVILAAELSNLSADAPHLPGLLNQALMNASRSPMLLPLDAGYYSDRNLRFLAGRGVEAFIPPSKVRHSHWRAQQPPRGGSPKTLLPLT